MEMRTGGWAGWERGCWERKVLFMGGELKRKRGAGERSKGWKERAVSYRILLSSYGLDERKFSLHLFLSFLLSTHPLPFSLSNFTVLSLFLFFLSLSLAHSLAIAYFFLFLFFSLKATQEAAILKVLNILFWREMGDLACKRRRRLYAHEWKHTQQLQKEQDKVFHREKKKFQRQKIKREGGSEKLTSLSFTRRIKLHGEQKALASSTTLI